MNWTIYLIVVVSAIVITAFMMPGNDELADSEDETNLNSRIAASKWDGTFENYRELVESFPTCQVAHFGFQSKDPDGEYTFDPLHGRPVVKVLTPLGRLHVIEAEWAKHSYERRGGGKYGDVGDGGNGGNGIGL